MSTVHLHLLINHAPFFGITFALLLLVISLAKNLENFRKLGLIIMILSSLLIVPTYFSGEKSEEDVEHLPGVSERIIEEHEDAGKMALGLSGLLGVLALATLFLKDKNQKIALYSLLLVGLMTEASIAKTANLGGQIRHTEIRWGNYSGSFDGEDKDSKDKDKDSDKDKDKDKDKDSDED